MKNLKSFNESFNTYSKYDRWEVKPDVDVYDSDWKKLHDYFREEYRRGNEIDYGSYTDEKVIFVDYSNLSAYWKRWFDNNMIRTEKG
jgi:hypothetical protein